ncbi:hypothetical protein NWF24_17805 [Variovorax paradoxus]|uniref:type II toxin-antitoxin system RelE family toxin n=1 Tax=Variovorax paradoxus TaxID=34073 RepID=UPI0021ABA848|nr:hypothetical protein [Variovorax paradoxus]UVH54702.1 hypothetical protein NWF24_17805 [Variovorax paradoxus]
MAITVAGFDFSERFRIELSALDPQIQKAAKEALDLLQKNPAAKSLRLHPLKDYAKPTIWKIDVFTNKSHQITFELISNIANLKRIATHSEIDRAPR